MTNDTGEPSPVSPPPYRLTYVGDSASATEREAELTSPLLDATLHPDGRCGVLIEARAALGQAFALDPFHTASLVDYLHGQDRIRAAVAAGLDGELAEWRAADGPPAGRGDVWARARVLHLMVGPRNAPTPEQVAKMRALFPDVPIESLTAAYDRPDTRSSFTLVLEVDWDEEHQRWAQFRDGALVSLSAT